MSDKSPEKSQHSFFSFWRHGFKKASKKAFDKYGYALAIFAFLYTIGAVCLSKKYPNVELWGFDMSFWVGLAIPGALLVAFFVYHLFRAPYEINLELHKKYEDEIAARDATNKKIADEIQKFKEQTKPLEIEPISTAAVLPTNPTADQRVAVVKNNLADCSFEIHNSNPTRTVGGIELRLLKIEPPMENAAIVTRQKILGRMTSGNLKKQSSDSTDHCDFSSMKFPISDDVLNADGKCRIRIFTAERWGEEIVVKFDCQWKDSISNGFTPNDKHTLTIEVSATDLKTKTARFKLSFFSNPQQIRDGVNPSSTKSKEPVFTLEKIASLPI